MSGDISVPTCGESELVIPRSELRADKSKSNVASCSVNKNSIVEDVVVNG